MLGINGPEFLVLALIALLVIGPERLPHYAAQLGRMVRELRRMATGAREQVRQELGPEFDDIDWQKLDPRQYDPRRIVREALNDTWDPPSGSAASAGAAGAGAAGAAVAGRSTRRPPSGPGGGRGARRPGDAPGTAPFDSEAT